MHADVRENDPGSVLYIRDSCTYRDESEDEEAVASTAGKDKGHDAAAKGSGGARLGGNGEPATNPVLYCMKFFMVPVFLAVVFMAGYVSSCRHVRVSSLAANLRRPLVHTPGIANH